MASEKKSSGDLTNLYLIFYNLGQTLGWLYILVTSTKHLLTDGYNTLYDEISTSLCWFQTLALLEVVHAALGLVRSNPVLTGFQVASRVFVTWHVWLVPTVHGSIGVSLFLLAWSITEVIRYSFYACGLFNKSPFVLQWLRYTLFIVLYPMGVVGELTCVYQSLSHVKNNGILSVSLPNRANVAFNYYYMLIFIMLMYFPIFPQLYKHMFVQRKKVVSGGVQKKTA